MADLKLIAGLGNPGKQYECTRHNLGFLVVRRLAEKIGVNFYSSSLAKALASDSHWKTTDLMLLLPLTYVNQSGSAVKSAVQKNKIFLKNILIICDDLNLNFGQMRLKAVGSSGGHNGLSSIIEALGTENFPRLRLGIKSLGGAFKDNRDKNQEVVNFVLGKFTELEEKSLERLIEGAVQCCLMWLEEGIDKTMSFYNHKTL